MKRLYLLVEGPSEEAFAKQLLVDHLGELGLAVWPIIVETSRGPDGSKHRGGGRWARWLKDLSRLSLQHRGPSVRFTTLFDLYGLPEDFPSLDEANGTVDRKARAVALEEAMKRAFAEATGGDWRLIPYLQVHEFEALVIASLPFLAEALDDEAKLGLTALSQEIGSLAPEDVNDGKETAPSKRLGRAIPGYRKVVHGPGALQRAGLPLLRERCPRFASWLAQLEAFARSA